MELLRLRALMCRGCLEYKTWPDTPEGLIEIQRQLAALSPQPWSVTDGMRAIAGCWICYPKGHKGKGAAGDPCWAAAALIVDGSLRAVETLPGCWAAEYQPGLLALREGPWLEKAVRRLPRRPDALLVHATGLDHPRRAGLGLHLGAVLSIPTMAFTLPIGADLYHLRQFFKPDTRVCEITVPICFAWP